MTDIDCAVTASLSIDFVPIPNRYFLPTAVSQNVLSGNGMFFLQTVDWADDLTYDIDIYDRWGGLMHSKREVLVNDESQAWIPRDVNAGVYTYQIRVNEFFESQFLEGTITVIE